MKLSELHILMAFAVLVAALAVFNLISACSVSRTADNYKFRMSVGNRTTSASDSGAVSSSVFTNVR